MGKRIFIIIFLLSGLYFGLVACKETEHVPEVPAVAPTQSAPVPADLRNYRYCEVIPVFKRDGKFQAEVYNTIGLNLCPAEKWQALDARTLAESFRAVNVKLNGPRYWVLNSMSVNRDLAVKKVGDFGGIEMSLVAIVEQNMTSAGIDDTPYRETKVQRTVTWHYKTGNMVYELTSPAGDVYRMQSYAQFVDPDQTINSLETLGQRLTLPQGWSYRAWVPHGDSSLIADGEATIVLDDFSNTYQKMKR